MIFQKNPKSETMIDKKSPPPWKKGSGRDEDEDVELEERENEELSGSESDFAWDKTWRRKTTAASINKGS